MLADRAMPTVASCTAVGVTCTAGDAPSPRAERWNGTSWAIQTTPNPLGDTDIGLNGVSCFSASTCTAIGNYQHGSVGPTLAEQWDGTSWVLQSTPNPKGFPVNYLYGVSCSAGTCIAAGGTQSPSQLPFVEREAG
jgi:hypothetical protein